MRACTALVLLSACGGAPVATAAAEASTPAAIWRDVARVNVMCLVQTETGVDQGNLHKRICNGVRDAAAVGSPAPVQVVALGDPAVLSPDSVTLLVQASTQGSGLLAFSIRPYRSQSEALLFTAAPRAVPLAGAGPAKEFETALGAALSETLPWLSRPAGARPIR